VGGLPSVVVPAVMERDLKDLDILLTEIKAIVLDDTKSFALDVKSSYFSWMSKLCHAVEKGTEEIEVDKLYEKLVVSKIESCDPNKVVVHIKDHIIYEPTFVNAFKPEGEMVSIIIHAQCCLLRKEYRDHIYLKQNCIEDLLTGDTKNLKLQLDKKS
jgi:hypothetical protein